MVDVVSNASEGTMIVKRCCLKSFKVFKWRILFTNSGWGLEEAPASLLVNNKRGIKNPGQERKFEVHCPFCEMYKHALAPRTPKKS